MEELANHVKICLENYQQLSELIREHITDEIIETRKNLISMLINIHCCCQTAELQSERFPLGSICYAPRFTEGIMDLALVISKYENNDDVYILSWIYPRNHYELASQGIRMDIERLQPYTEEMNLERVHRLQNISHNSNVLVQNHKGIFIPGKVSKRFTNGLSHTDEKILEIICENALNSKITTYTVPEDILIVVPSSLKEEISHQNHQDSSSSQNDNSDEVIDVTPVGFTPQSIAGLNLLQETNHLLGDWERHTKGVGSKLMEKMGYIRGEGLGKWGQGRIEPIDGMNVLPQGVSLDYIHETIEEKEINKMIQKRRKKKANSDQNDYRQSQQLNSADVFDFINTTCGTTNDAQQEELVRSVLFPNSPSLMMASITTATAATISASNPASNSASSSKNEMNILKIDEMKIKLTEKLEKLKQSLQRNIGKELGLCEQLIDEIRRIERELISLSTARGAITSQLNRIKLKEKTKIKKIF